MRVAAGVNTVIVDCHVFTVFDPMLGFSGLLYYVRGKVKGHPRTGLEGSQGD